MRSRSVRTKWIVIVTGSRVVRIPLSRLTVGAAAVILVLAVMGVSSLAASRAKYRERARDVAWLQQRLGEKRALVQRQHDALSTVVADLAELREEAVHLAAIKDRVRALGRVEGHDEISYERVRERPLQTPIGGNAGVMVGYAAEDVAVVREVTQETAEALALLVAILERPEGIRPDVPTLWPVRGMITSDFGPRRLGRRPENHRGVDIRGRYGTPIVAAASGQVIYAGRDSGYGNLIVIDHGTGVRTWYGHLAAMYVRKGAKLKRGQRIGALGDTGRTTGPHLHFEVRVNGTPVNPVKYLVN
jgi:murein DD-endopeptidase MepM/ murein hydrolase activator NlpD